VFSGSDSLEGAGDGIGVGVLEGGGTGAGAGGYWHEILRGTGSRS
jgi:hypothetical protein